MKREDWFWLLIKAAGLWLIVGAFEAMAEDGFSWVRDSRFGDRTGTEILGRLVLQLGGGAVLLFGDFSKAASGGRSPANLAAEAKAEAEVPQRGVSRDDCLWVGLKLVGAYFVIVEVTSMIHTLAWFATGDSPPWAVIGPPWEVLVSGVVGLAIALWFLLGEGAFRLACGSRRIPRQLPRREDLGDR